MSITFQEALLTLERTGPVLETAREVSQVLRASGIQGAIIGGVAVGLHGYLRTTVDVDVLVLTNSKQLADELQRHGFSFDAEHSEFLKRNVPVHIVTLAQLGAPPRKYIEIDGIQTVSLGDLISIKLRSGSNNILRSKDLGDAVGLIRHHGLTKDFLPQIEKDVRDEFRTVVDAISRESSGG